jgi:hypothetical protein
MDQSEIAMAYTFHTQTILDTAVKLGALPYSTPAATGNVTATVLAETPAQAFAKYGVNPSAVGGVPSNHIHEILEVDITTFNLLDDLTGAFMSDPTMAAPEVIHVMIATPILAATPACQGALAALSTNCAPLMVFRHGLGGGRADMLTVADTYAANGMVTVAIDAAKHGDRSYCTSGAATTNIPGVTVPQCSGAGTCDTMLPSGAQGDSAPPGKCSTGFFYRPVSSFCSNPANFPVCQYTGANGIPVDSSNYLVTSNFFRTRDTFRQDFIDQSQLIRALALIPGTGATSTVFDYMKLQNVIIDPSPGKIYFSGQSLGSIQGVGDVATNPRIAKAAFNVGGGTVVDIFTNSPAFVASTNALLASLGVVPGTSQYLQFLVVAKTVLDPADPINFAGHLTGNNLPNLLSDQSGQTPQLPKKVLAQAANCDATVPNPFNLILAENFNTAAPTSPATVGPLPSSAAFFAPGATGTFQLFTGPGFNPANFGTCSTGALEHGFLTDWTTASSTFNAQSDISAFVVNDTIPFSVR